MQYICGHAREALLEILLQIQQTQTRHNLYGDVTSYVQRPAHKSLTGLAN